MTPPISDEECAKFERSFSSARVNGGGQFRLADIDPPAGEADETWPYRIVDERDTSRLQAIAVDSISSFRGTVIDRTLCGPGGVVRQRIVSVFALDEDQRRLVSVKARNERASLETASLAAAAYEDYLAAIGARGLQPAAGPLLCLDPELADARDRRRLIASEISYALQVDAGDVLNHVSWRPEHPMDAREPLHVEDIVPIYWPGADPSKAAVVPIKDLADQRPGATGRYDEALLRIPRGDDSFGYYLCRPARTPRSRFFRAAGGLARQAEAHSRRSPAKCLRAHEFTHSNELRLCEVLRIVDRGRYLQGPEKPV